MDFCNIFTNATSRTKFYLIITFICISLFFYSVWEIKWVITDISDFLGLTSRLTLIYWIGLILITIVSICVYLDTTIMNKSVFLLVLFTIGLYLFGVSVFSEQNARFIVSYYPAAEVKTILTTSHINTTKTYPLISYRCWPAFHFISACLIYISGIELSIILKYMPLFWCMSAIFIIFSIGMRFHFSLNNCFLICFLFISSFWLPQYYYSPQCFAFITYLLLFLLFITTTKEVQYKIITIIIFSSSVIMHMITPIIICVYLLVKSLFSNKYSYTILFILLFISWYIFLAPLIFKMGILEFKSQVLNISFLSFTETSKFVGTSEIKKCVSNLRLAYLFIYFVVGGFAIVSYIKEFKYLKYRTIKYKSVFNNCFFWLISASSLLLICYGNEQFERAYMFSLIPIGCIIIIYNSRKLMVALMILFITIHIPAHYGSESFDQVSTAELAGAEFLALKKHPQELFIYNGVSLVWYVNPESITSPFKRFRLWSPNKIDELCEVKYIIDCDRSYNLLMYYYNYYPIGKFLATVEVDTIYDSKFYKVYRQIEE